MKNSEVSIFISGDFCPVGRIAQKSKVSDVSEIFNGLEDRLKDLDVRITNLECPLTDSDKPILKTGPGLKASARSASFLKEAGFNLVTLANNHIKDYGKKGITDTLMALQDNGIDYVGAYEDTLEKNEVYFYNKEDLRIAIVNVTENEWSTLNNDGSAAYAIDSIDNYYKISYAKEHADKVVLITHGGHELYNLPSPEMKRRFRFYCDAGADIVVNHHPHYISGFEVYKGKPIFYSLGNFIFDNSSYLNSDWNTGISIIVKINKSNVHFEILSFEQCNEQVGVFLHDPKKAKETQKYIESLNVIIKDDHKLKSAFEKFLQQRKRLYLSYIEPHRNKYLFYLQNRNILPRLLGKRKKRLLLNLLRSESHREALEQILLNETGYTS